MNGRSQESLFLKVAVALKLATIILILVLFGKMGWDFVQGANPGSLKPIMIAIVVTALLQLCAWVAWRSTSRSNARKMP